MVAAVSTNVTMAQVDRSTDRQIGGEAEHDA
jgi:hypothetical protein